MCLSSDRAGAEQGLGQRRRYVDVTVCTVVYGDVG